MESIDEFLKKVNVSKYIFVEIPPNDVDKLLHLDGRIQVVFPKKRSPFVHLMITSTISEQNYNSLVELGYKPDYIYDYDKKMRNAITKVVKDEYVDRDVSIKDIESDDQEVDAIEEVEVVPEEKPIPNFDVLRKSIVIPTSPCSSDTEASDEGEEPTPYQIFLKNLQDLKPAPSKHEVGNLMYFAIKHSSFASALAELICSAVLDKPAVLYLVNDLLANINCGYPDAWKFKVELEKILPKLFKQLNLKWKPLGLLRKEEMRKFVMGILMLWEKYIGLESVNQLRNNFLGWEQVNDEDLGLNKPKEPLVPKSNPEKKIDEDSRFKPIESDIVAVTAPAVASVIAIDPQTPKLAIKPITLQPRKAFQMKLTTVANSSPGPDFQSPRGTIKVKKKIEESKPLSKPVEDVDDSVLLEPDSDIDGHALTEDELTEEEDNMESEQVDRHNSRKIQKIESAPAFNGAKSIDEESDEDMFA